MVYLFVALKVPLIAACWLIWWAIRAEPEPVDEPRDDGGAKLGGRDPHPREPRPRSPRRGPHGDPAPVAPARTRPLKPARARTPIR